MVMVHSDNTGNYLHIFHDIFAFTLIMLGLVVPPRVARIQVMIIPAGLTAKAKGTDAMKAILAKCQELASELNALGIRASTDFREDKSVGWKFNHWELMGVPLRLELGPKDMEKSQVTTARRDTKSKEPVPLDQVTKAIPALLEKIQQDMLARAKAQLADGIIDLRNYGDFVKHLNNKKLVWIPFCGGKECEGKIKDDTAKVNISIYMLFSYFMCV